MQFVKKIDTRPVKNFTHNDTKEVTSAKEETKKTNLDELTTKMSDIVISNYSKHKEEPKLKQEIQPVLKIILSTSKGNKTIIPMKKDNLKEVAENICKNEGINNKFTQNAVEYFINKSLLPIQQTQTYFQPQAPQLPYFSNMQNPYYPPPY